MDENLGEESGMIETRFELFVPSDRLKPYIRKYYLFEGPNIGIINKIPAWTKSVMVLQCGGRLGADFDKGYRNITPASFNGPVITPYSYDTDSPYFRFFVIEFTAIGTYSLFREESEHFMDTSIDVLNVIPAVKRHQLIEALSELHDMSRKVEIVEIFLSQFLPDEHGLYRIKHVMDTINLIERSSGAISVDEISKELKFSYKHLGKGMKEVTGMTTKQFATLTRIQHVFNAVIDGKFNFEQLEAMNSYFDQAHLIKEFKRYTGYSPKKIPKESFAFSRMFNL